MKYVLSVVWGLLIFGGASSLKGQTTFPKPGISSKNTVYHLIKDAVVHTAPGQGEPMDVLIYKGKIIDAGVGLSHPDNTVVHAYPGMHVFPSFVEIDSDYGMGAGPSKDGNTGRGSRGPNPERSRDVAVYWNEAYHPEVDAIEGFTPDTARGAKLRAMGVGTVLTHRHDGIARGSSALVLSGDGTSNDLVLASRAAMQYSFDKGSSRQDFPTSLMGAIALLRQAFYDVEWYARSPREEVNFSLEAALAKRSLPKIFEAKNAYDIERIGRLAEEFGTNFIVRGTGDTYRVLPLSRIAPEAIIAPLDFPDPYDVGDPELARFITQTDLLRWERAPYNPSYIVQSGIPLVLSMKGLKDDKEVFKALRKAIASGLDGDTALAALTTVPARLLGVADRIGKLEKGFDANFFIATGDPRTDEKAEIVTHWVGGREYVVTERQLAALKGRYNLNLNTVYVTLVVGGDTSPKAHVEDIQSGDTTKVDARIDIRSHEVGLSFRNPRGDGSYRLSATMLTDYRVWDGFGTAPNGDNIAWTAIRVAEKSKATKMDSIARDSINLPPVIRTPLTAYGYDTLPMARTIWIKNATLWTNDSAGVIPKGSLLISDGKIVAVGTDVDPERDLPKGKNALYAVMDAGGKNITPGIIDEHSHIAIERGVNEGSEASSAEVRIADALNPADINIFRQLAGGVTTSQLLHGSANPIGGQSAIVKLRWGESAEGMIFKEAPPFIKFALGENVKQTNWGDLYNRRYPQTRMGVEQFYYESLLRAREYGRDKKIEEAREQSAAKKRKKKSPSAPSDFRRDLELDALLEILENERFITCHSYVQSEMEMLLHVADSMGFKLNTFTHALEAYKIADDIKRHGTAASTFSDWWAYKYEVRDAIPYNASILNRLGVLTAINSDDAEMGRRLNQEAAKSIRYGGMSEEDALKMITLNPAKMLHVDAYVGSLTPGKQADFVIWSDHPLSVYAVAEKTFIDGKLYFDRSRLEELVERDHKDRVRIANLMLEAKEKGADTKKPEREEEQLYHCDSL